MFRRRPAGPSRNTVPGGTSADPVATTISMLHRTHRTRYGTVWCGTWKAGDDTGAGIIVSNIAERYKVSLNIIIHMRILCNPLAIIDGPELTKNQSGRIKKGMRKNDKNFTRR
jgi:hypothetical protein